MKVTKRHIILAVILLTSVMAAVAFAAEGNGKLKVQIPTDPQLYSKTPQPLTPEQCAQCHPSTFQSIKENGGKQHAAKQGGGIFLSATSHTQNYDSQNIAGVQRITENVSETHDRKHGHHSECSH